MRLGAAMRPEERNDEQKEEKEIIPPEPKLNGFGVTNDELLDGFSNMKI